MAKKKSMNLMEAHLEKIVLLLALICFVWVLYARFVRASGIESGGRTVKSSELARQAAEQAEGILRSIKEKSTGTAQSIDPWKSPLETFARLQPLESSPVDAIPMSPPFEGKGGIEEEKRLYTVPEILALSDLKIDLNHAPVVVPAAAPVAGTPVMEGEISAAGQPSISFSSGMQVKDIDFVTVEAKFSLAEMHTLFRRNFTGPTVKKALELPDPIVAAVDLQRSRLLPDGQWGPWEKTPRLSVDPMAEKTLMTEDFTQISRANFDVLLENRKDPTVQLMILEPLPYSLLSGTWLPPSEKEEFEKKQKELKRLSTTAAAGVGSGAAGPAYGQPDRGGDRPPERDRGMEREERREVSSPSFSGSLTGMDTFRYQAILSKPWDGNEKITLWAHDDQVEPGQTYRYRIRLGFFNPIAGHNWFTKEQESLKNQIVLWSPWSSPDKVVRIPEHMLFFPVLASRGSEQTFKMDVYREQEGVWHRQRFDVVPGLTVGYPMEAEEDAASKAMDAAIGGINPTEKKKIDFSTGITIVDVFPRVRYFTTIGRTISEVNTPAILYQNSDGTIQRLPVDKLAWPEGWAAKKTQIDRLISDRKKAMKPAAAEGGMDRGGAGERRGVAPVPGRGEGRRAPGGRTK